ncbi:MAG TPA: ligand-binding protein SH3 [Methanosarcinales archaeon]|nr:ligand-binding protein SH3 [Methanosarcinales archaeon]
MIDSLVAILESVPHPVATMLIASMPVAELRGAIPVAIGVYGMDPLTAYTLAVIGNMMPVVPLLLFLESVSNYLRRWVFWDVFFNWLFTRTYHRHNAGLERYGTIALLLFVAIPLPVTGAWTGCAAAFVFGIQFRHALAAIVGGVMLAGVIVTAATLAGIGFFGLL